METSTPTPSKYEVVPEAFARPILQSYNPYLALRPNLGIYKRPGASWRGRNGRGDYHPCSAEFFLEHSALYENQRPIYQFWGKKQPQGLEYLKKRVAERSCANTEDWELDIATIDKSSIRFGSAALAWREYQRLRNECPAAKDCVTYARCLKTRERYVLQYFYLYLYNDAANKHEGDWESVAIELDRKDKKPIRAGFSGHRGGARRIWEGLTRKGDNNRPVVFVARGSHAAYLEHMPGGHHTAKAEWAKTRSGLGHAPVGAVERLISTGLFFLGIRDYTNTIVGAGEHPLEGPVRLVSPEIRTFPANTPLPGDSSWDEFWWMNLDCRWGSSRPRIREFIAPPPPWKQGMKWEDPLRWIEERDAH